MVSLFRGKLRVLVPGAGLGRLAWDIANLGEPNEIVCSGNTQFQFADILSLQDLHVKGTSSLTTCF